MKLKAITWNLFHGRDAPPDRSLWTWRSRLTGRAESNPTHRQVNRDLTADFIEVLHRNTTPPHAQGAKPDWDLALLQECPPRWVSALAKACGAQAHLALTSRNSLSAIRAAVAKINPDLVASAEGGSNLTLARPRAGAVVLRRELILTRRTERRVMAFTELSSGLCVANLHATNDRPTRAADELMRAAETASRWAKERPLIFGGDFNLRPDESPGAFAELNESYGLSPPTGPGKIDHLLSRNLEIVRPPAAWPSTAREVAEDGLAVRLSDHAPVGATYATL